MKRREIIIIRFLGKDRNNRGKALRKVATKLEDLGANRILPPDGSIRLDGAPSLLYYKGFNICITSGCDPKDSDKDIEFVNKHKPDVWIVGSEYEWESPCCYLKDCEMEEFCICQTIPDEQNQKTLEKACENDAERIVRKVESATTGPKVGVVTADHLRDSYYDRYKEELNRLWRNSLFIWGFEVLLFTGFGWLLGNALTGRKVYSLVPAMVYREEMSSLWPIAAGAICFLGFCVSAIWVALAKSSRTWQEWYEHQIGRLEGDNRYFLFDYQQYAMSGFRPESRFDKSLWTLIDGRFSPGKLNIFIAQCVLVLWIVLFTMSLALEVFRKIPPLWFLGPLGLEGGLSFWFYHTLKSRCLSRYLFEKDCHDSYEDLWQGLNEFKLDLEGIKKDNDRDSEKIWRVIAIDYKYLISVAREEVSTVWPFGKRWDRNSKKKAKSILSKMNSLVDGYKKEYVSHKLNEESLDESMWISDALDTIESLQTIIKDAYEKKVRKMV